jgi:hypothetical protein
MKNRTWIRRVRHLLLVSTLLSVPAPFVSTLTPAASACSITAPGPTAKYVYFTGKAIKREFVSDIIWPTYQWTFVVKKWDRDSSGKRRKVGSKIAVSVVEVRREPTTTLANGAINSCADIELGITTEFRQNKVYNVTAQISESGREYTINRSVGLIQ